MSNGLKKNVPKSNGLGKVYQYSYFIMSENIINLLLCTMYICPMQNLTIQLSQFDEYPTSSLELFIGHRWGIVSQ